MLDRAAASSGRRQRQAVYRRRQRAGVIALTIEVDASTIELPF
jgi:hypothetical protein